MIKPSQASAPNRGTSSRSEVHVPNVPSRRCAQVQRGQVEMHFLQLGAQPAMETAMETFPKIAAVPPNHFPFIVIYSHKFQPFWGYPYMSTERHFKGHQAVGTRQSPPAGRSTAGFRVGRIEARHWWLMTTPRCTPKGPGSAWAGQKLDTICSHRGLTDPLNNMGTTIISLEPLVVLIVSLLCISRFSSKHHWFW